MQTINLKDKLRYGKTFCVYPFVHYYTDVKKDRYVCCYALDKTDDSDIVKMRKDMLADVPVPTCSKCYKQEESQIISNRQLAIRDFLNIEDKVNQSIDHFLNGEPVEPISYDLRYSNLCNLECQICNSTVSSSIAKTQGKEVVFFSYEPDLKVNPNTSRIYLAGGEPFLIKKYVKVLESIENLDCEVVINTNATVLTENMLSVLDKFNNVSFTVSIDGYGELNDRLRKNSKWDSIVDNVKTLINRYGNRIQINTVIQRDNVNHLLPLGKWIESMGITIWTLSELNNQGEHYYKNCQDITIPDELFKLSVVSTSIKNIKLLKQICLN
jgi:sulfatase maturation enzyme AslB (radical SAM superfamily)